MKKLYTEEPIIKAIKEYEAEAKVDDIWRRKYADMEVNEAKRLRELEAENNCYLRARQYESISHKIASLRLFTVT